VLPTELAWSVELIVYRRVLCIQCESNSIGHDAIKHGQGFFMSAAHNAYIIQNFKISHKQPAKQLVTLHIFCDQLCHELIGAFRCCSTPTLCRTSKPNEARLANGGNVPQHLVEKPPHATTNNHCVVCTENYQRAKLMNPGVRDVDLPKWSKTICTSCEDVKSFCVYRVASKSSDVMIFEINIETRFFFLKSNLLHTECHICCL